MGKGPARKKLISLTHGMHEYRRWSWPVPAYKWHWQGPGGLRASPHPYLQGTAYWSLASVA